MIFLSDDKNYFMNVLLGCLMYSFIYVIVVYLFIDLYTLQVVYIHIYSL